MTNQHGEKTSLGAFRGKTVVLVPFLTLCADICPFTTGILLQVEKALKAAHATSKVEIVELSVDPHRDTVARLAAYAKLTHAGWQLVTDESRRPGEVPEVLRVHLHQSRRGQPARHRLDDGQAADLRHRPFRQLLRDRPGGQRADRRGRGTGLHRQAEPQASEVPQPRRAASIRSIRRSPTGPRTICSKRSNR